jgi:sugar O-acyltransferase (sialic acid O-acetyltransferase NeuD family)
MIIIGAGGHAKEIAGVLNELDQASEAFFFDDVTENAPQLLLGKYKIIRSETEAKKVIASDPRFALGIGSPKFKYQLTLKFESWGGQLTSVISPFARIGNLKVELGQGITVMTGAVITEDVVIGRGSLVHVQASVHHDCRIGDFCDLLPGCHVLGKVVIGDFTTIGSGAIILPQIKIGNNVMIGAGSVVTKDLPDGAIVKGVPAK